MEAFLIAQAVPTGPTGFDWERILMQYGPMYVLFGLMVYFILWYGPGLLEAHRNMINTVAASSKSAAEATTRTAEATETLTENLGQAVTAIRATQQSSDEVRQDIHCIKKALGHSALAGEKLLRESGRKSDSDVIIELRKAQVDLENGKRS